MCVCVCVCVCVCARARARAFFVCFVVVDVVFVCLLGDCLLVWVLFLFVKWGVGFVMLLLLFLFSSSSSSRLCPSTAGCSPPSMSSIFVCLLLS